MPLDDYLARKDWIAPRQDRWSDILPESWQTAINTSPTLNALARYMSRPSFEEGVKQWQDSIPGNSPIDRIADRKSTLAQEFPQPMNPLGQSLMETGGFLATFLGPGAKTANLPALARAQQKAAAGVPREQIWREDGWFQGPDQKWRFEVDDSGFRFKGGEGRLAEVAPQKAVSEAYPSLDSLEVGSLPSGGVQRGRYVPQPTGAASIWNRITGRGGSRIDVAPEAGRKGLLHERQHAIDDIEGAIPRGPNAYGENAPKNLAELARSKTYTDAPFEQIARATENRADLTSYQRMKRPPWEDYGTTAPQQSMAPWAKRQDNMSVLPERAAAEAALSDLPRDQVAAFLDGVRGKQLSPDQQRMWDILTDPGWTNPKSKAVADALRSYRDKAQQLGHNGGPATSTWNDGFVYSLDQTAPKPQGIRAYHGSPHDFDKFDISKIGTGEGAQAYGRGLYFAENEGVARSYRDQLAQKHVRVLGGDADASREMETARTLLKQIRGPAKKSPYGDVDLETAAKTAEGWRSFMERDGINADRVIEILRRGEIKPDPGRMYEVNIKADPDQFLDWDKPLSQQTEGVRKALSTNWLAEPEAAHARQSVGSMYDALGVKGADSTKLLRDAGIPGIKYKDQMSRGTDGGTSNFVVFDDALIEILRKYGLLPPVAAGAAQALSQGQDTAY